VARRTGVAVRPGLVPSTVAGTLVLKVTGKISAESVGRAVGGRHLVLVLDNCEHVIDVAANLAETFTRLCPRTTIVATSREVLRIDGESVYRVPPSRCPLSGKRRRTTSCNTARWSCSSPVRH
jgi:predicted ATPase